MILFPVIPSDPSVVGEIVASPRGDGGTLRPCFWLSQYAVSTASPADSCTSGVVIACLDGLASLLRVSLDIYQNTDPSSGAADGFVPCGGPDRPQSAPAPPTRAGRAVRERQDYFCSCGAAAEGE